MNEDELEVSIQEQPSTSPRESPKNVPDTSASSQNWMTKPIAKWTFDDFLQAKAHWDEAKEITLRRSYLNAMEEMGEPSNLEKLRQKYEVTILEDE